MPEFGLKIEDFAPHATGSATNLAAGNGQTNAIPGRVYGPANGSEVVTSLNVHCTSNSGTGSNLLSMALYEFDDNQPSPTDKVGDRVAIGEASIEGNTVSGFENRVTITVPVNASLELGKSYVLAIENDSGGLSIADGNSGDVARRSTGAAYPNDLANPWTDGGGVARDVALWADYTDNSVDPDPPYEKSDFIGAFVVGPVAQKAMDNAAGLRASEMYDVLMTFRSGGGAVPSSVADRQGTFVIPDIESVNSILVAGTTRGHEFLSAMVANSGT